MTKLCDDKLRSDKESSCLRVKAERRHRPPTFLTDKLGGGGRTETFAYHQQASSLPVTHSCFECISPCLCANTIAQWLWLAFVACLRSLALPLKRLMFAFASVSQNLLLLSLLFVPPCDIFLVSLYLCSVFAIWFSEFMCLDTDPCADNKVFFF